MMFFTNFEWGKRQHFRYLVISVKAIILNIISEAKLKNRKAKQAIIPFWDLWIYSFSRPVKKHPHYFNDEELSSLNSLLIGDAIVQQSVDFINTRNHDLPPVLDTTVS